MQCWSAARLAYAQTQYINILTGGNMAVYDPALMLRGGAWLDTVYVVGKALLAIGLWGAAAIGHLRSPLNWAERIFVTAAAFLLVLALPTTDEAGFVMGAAFLLFHFVKTRRVATAPVSSLDGEAS